MYHTLSERIWPARLRNVEYLPAYNLPKHFNDYSERALEYMLPDLLNSLTQDVKDNVFIAKPEKTI